jgi:ABC-2 type transport system ATP-binding protein
MSIVVEDLHKHYQTTIAVDGLSFRVDPGEILGLVGPNGAGKTTTIRALAGILTPTFGKLSIDGHDVNEDPVAAKALLAYVPDDPRLFDQLTVWEHFRFVAAVYRVTDWTDRAERLLVDFNLVEKRHALAGELSRGMRQKVAIACGYLHDPKAIVLDEPLTGLDPRGIRDMKTSIRGRAAAGAAVILSSHQLSLVEDICTSILIMRKGRSLLLGELDRVRREMEAEGRRETLEDLFFRLTEGPESDARNGESNASTASVSAGDTPEESTAAAPIEDRNDGT